MISHPHAVVDDRPEPKSRILAFHEPTFTNGSRTYEVLNNLFQSGRTATLTIVRITNTVNLGKRQLKQKGHFATIHVD
jgi:hypothetical protein